MTSFLVDPVVLMPPTQGSAEAHRQWLGLLEAWVRQALSSLYDEWFHVVVATQWLYAQNRFPSFQEMRLIQQRYGLYDLPIQTLARDIQTFFGGQERDLETRLTNSGYLAQAQENSVEIRPDVIPSRWPEPVKQTMYGLLVTCGWCSLCREPMIDDLSMVTTAFAIAPPDGKVMKVLATLQDAFPELPPEVARDMSHEIPLLFAPEDIQTSIDLSLIETYGVRGLERLVAEECGRAHGSSGKEPLTFQFGDQFMDSLTTSAIGTNPSGLRKLVSVMAAVIADVASGRNVDLRHFRENANPNAQQIVRAADQGEGWRLTIASGAVGWRLNFWSIPSTTGVRRIEFANIQKKNEPERIV